MHTCSMHIRRNPDYLHHSNTISSALLREVVFGMEDGMVSTMGAITGIAIGTSDPFVIILAGFVIISVESISMAVGSYLSNKSEQAMDKRILAEEKEEIEQYPHEEKAELLDMFVADGWPKKLAEQMAEAASKNKDLMLKEMAYRELQLHPDSQGNPRKNAVYMGFSYIGGGFVPLIPYLATPLKIAIPLSIGITLVALFILGVFTTKFTKRNWLKAGTEMLILASIAAGIGFGIAKLANMFFGVEV